MNKNRLYNFSIARIAAAAFAGFCLLTAANAQNAPQQRDRVAAPTPTPPAKQQEVVESDDTPITVDSRLVVVPVSVIDQNGEPVRNLTAADFQLDEEARRQQISDIAAPEQVPLEIAVLFDVSSSVNKIFDIEKDAAARFVQNVMKSQDRATLFLVNQKPEVALARATGEEMAAKVRSIPPAKVTTATAFYDTVMFATDYLKKNAPERTRRVVLVLSDGEDNFSESVRSAETVLAHSINVNTVTQSDLNKRASAGTRVHLAAQSKVLQNLQQSDIVFYSINPSGPSIRLNVASQRAQDGMQRFADETGGTAFLPQIQQNNSKDQARNQQSDRQNQETLEKIFKQIAAELRAQYLLQYYSETNYDAGKYVKLKVALPAKNNLRVRARQGYFATAAK